MDVSHKIFWDLWETLCHGKFDGGLGKRNLSIFNQALLAKLGWYILRHPQSFSRSTFLNVSKSKNSLYLWSSIIWDVVYCWLGQVGSLVMDFLYSSGKITRFNLTPGLDLS